MLKAWFAIMNDGDGKYFGEAYTTQVSAETRIEELEETFGKGSFYIERFPEPFFDYYCDVCLREGDSSVLKVCPNCA